METYKISVIVPCYNISQYVESCMNCLNAQTFKDFEIICINDGSTDDTLTLLNQYKCDKLKVISTENLGVSHARNEGIRQAIGDFLYFFDPDDYIEPKTLEIIYNKAKETNADAVQFNYKTIIVENQHIYPGLNGNKKVGIYTNKEIIDTYLQNFIGYSSDSIKEYGKPRFSYNKEMCSVWRFLYKREIITNNKITFPTNILLGEDTFFNCYFFCFANKICFIDDVLYTYYSKKNGAMRSLLNRTDSKLFMNKIAGVHERAHLRALYKEKYHIDIFSLYAGSLFLSTIELAIKASNTLKELQLFKNYTKIKDVRDAISFIPLQGNFKIITLLILLKMRLYTSFFLIIFFIKKLGYRLQ